MLVDINNTWLKHIQMVPLPAVKETPVKCFVCCKVETLNSKVQSRL